MNANELIKAVKLVAKEKNISEVLVKNECICQWIAYVYALKSDGVDRKDTDTNRRDRLILLSISK